MAARDGSRRTALIGLDGATTRVLDPLVRAGVMPTLARLRQEGFEATLRSTIPAYTPPGWVSMATGVNPGRHGVFGFMDTTPQESPAIAHSGSIRASTIWSYLSSMDVRVGILNVPMSYPPIAVNGFLVAGGLATGWTDPEMPNFASDPEIGRFVLETAGGRYPLDTVVNYENDWRSPQTVTRIEDVQRLRRRVLGALLERADPEFVFAVFEGPDRLQHVFYQCLVECSDWYDRALSREVRERAYSYFAEVDRAIGDLSEWAGTDGNVVIVSDHGSGPWEKTVNVNLLLSEWGYAELPPLARLTRMRHVAGLGQRVARRVLPRSLLHRAKASIERGIVWESTRAFASHVAEQGVHVNVRGTLPRGIVEPPDVASIEDDLIERFLELRDPDDGETVTDRVYRRAEVIRGPYEARAPNLFPMLRGQRYELSDTLAASSPFTDHRDRPWGYHHLDGVFIARGPSIRAGSRGSELDIVDVLPTVLHLAAYPVPEGLDGHVATEAMDERLAARNIDTAPVAEAQPEPSEYPFTAADEEAITESLRGLGYIE